MKSWWKKAAALALGVYAFSVTSVFAGYITDGAQEVIEQVTNSIPAPTNQSLLPIYNEQIGWFKSTVEALAQDETEDSTVSDTEKDRRKIAFEINVLKEFTSYLKSQEAKVWDTTDKETYAKKNRVIVENLTGLLQTTLDKMLGKTSDADFAANAQKTLSNLKSSQAGESSCSLSLGTSFSLGACIDSAIGFIVRVTLVNLALGVFYLSSQFLQFTIAFGITSFAGLLGNINSTSSNVYTLWLLTRNLVWTGILFSFLYLILLELFDKKHEFGRAVAMITVFAIFSGFSFKASLMLIDFSNTATVTIYKGLEDPKIPGLGKWDDLATTDPLIGTRYMRLLGYQGLSESGIASGQTNSILDTTGGEGKTAVNLILAATMIFNAYVMTMMGILFTIRDIVLFAGVILSPLLLIDRVIPIMSEPAKKFRSLFFGQLLFAPIFMFCVYVGLQMSSTISSTLSGTASGSSFGVKIFNLVAVSAILYYTYAYCKKLSGAIGEGALRGLGSIAQAGMIATPLGLAGRAGAMLGQNTIGAAGRYLSRTDGSLAKNKSGMFGLNERIFNGANYLGNTAKYNFADSKVVANAGNALGKFTGGQNMLAPNDLSSRMFGKTKSMTEKEKETQERIKYINENYTNPEDRERAMQKAIGDGGFVDHVRRGGVTLLGDTLLNHATKKASETKPIREDLTTFAKGLKKDADEKVVKDGIDQINFEDGDLSKVTEEILKLREKANKQGPEAKKLFNKLLKQKLSSNFSSKIQSGKVLKSADGKTQITTENTLEEFKAAAVRYVEANADEVKDLFATSSENADENKKAREDFIVSLTKSLETTTEDIWAKENKRKNQIAKIKEENLRNNATRGPLAVYRKAKVPAKVALKKAA